ncbi:MAG: PRC-barrel domain-containing protein [Actinobacteria bacterium]|nr:PRC-barrel domain-containing protein [Actinomycetota bacterium]
MRLSDLLHSDVLDADGRDLGRVNDVLVAHDAPLLGGHVGPLKVEGLVVGGKQGTRLGFERGGAQGPWPISALFRHLERHACFVPWEAVASWEQTTIHLDRRADDLGPPPVV